MQTYRDAERDARLTEAARSAAAAGRVHVRSEDEAWELARAEAQRALDVFNRALHPVRLELYVAGSIGGHLFMARDERIWLRPSVEPTTGSHDFGCIAWRDRHWTSRDTHWDSFETYLLALAERPGFAQAVGLARQTLDDAPVSASRPRHAVRVATAALGIVAAGLLFAYLANLLT